MKLNRRSFIKKLANTSVLACAPGVFLACSKARRAKVIVIGAGLAGLNCARLLAEQGVEPIVLEAKAMAGGRTYSVNVDGTAINMGGIQIGDAYGRFISLAYKLGLTFFTPTPTEKGLSIYHDGGLMNAEQWSQVSSNLLPADLRALAPNRLESHLHFKDFPLSNTSDWLNPKFAYLDIPESERLKDLGADAQTIALINRNGNFNHIDQVSALHVMRGLANFRYGGSTKTLRLEGGNNGLALAMAKALPEVHYEHQVSRLRQTRKGITVDCSNGSQWIADYVVLALPFSVARKMQLELEIPDNQRRAINELPYTRITKLVARVEKPFWEQDGLPPDMWCNAPLERCFMSQSRRDERFYTAFINGVGTEGVDALNPGQASAWIMDQITTIRPATRGALTPVAFHSWANDPYAAGAYAAFAPGQITDFAKAMIQPANNLFFAGEHCAQRTSGLEGALESGEATASQILSLIV